MSEISVKVQLFLLFTICCLGCGKARVNTIEEYKNWVNNPENGLIKDRVVKDLTFKVYYRPIDYQLVKEIDFSKEYSIEELTKLRNGVGGSEYFMMTISSEIANLKEGDIASKSATSAEYLEKMEELSFGMENRLRLIVDGDTLAPLLFHHERGYELAQSQNYLIAFSTKEDKMQKEMTFVYDDKIFGVNKLNFKFAIDKNKIPDLPVKIKSTTL